MWPSPVEAVANAFRAARVEARLEELSVGEDEFPGTVVRVRAFDCDGRLVVALMPSDGRLAPSKLQCVTARAVDPPPFPFRGARIVLERALLNERTVWLEAGSSRYAVAVSPLELARILEAQPADLVADDPGEGS